MFKNLIESINDYKIKKELIKNFLKEHKQYLPKYSPLGQPLNWDISAYQGGEYNIYNGKRTGEYKISVLQKRPQSGTLCDENAYKYNIETKLLEKIKGCNWKLP